MRKKYVNEVHSIIKLQNIHSPFILLTWEIRSSRVSEGRRGLNPWVGEGSISPLPPPPRVTRYNRTCFCCRLLAVPLSLPVPHRDRHEPGTARGHTRGSAASAARLPPLRRLPTPSHVTLITLPPLTYCGPWPTLLRAWAPRQDGYRDSCTTTTTCLTFNSYQTLWFGLICCWFKSTNVNIYSITT